MYNLVENDWGELEYVPTLAGKIVTAIIAIVIFAVMLLLVRKSRKVSAKKLSAKQITFCAMAVALGTILSNLKLFSFPTGGSVTVLFMLVACLPGYWYGLGVGILSGITSGLLQLIFDPYIIHPAQLVLDYVCAFGALGLSGLFAEQKENETKSKIVTIVIGYVFAMLSGIFFFITHIETDSKLNYNIIFGILFAILYLAAIVTGLWLKNQLIKGYTVAVIGRYVFAVLSGYIFFGSYAWSGFGAVSYSVIYNAIYIFAEAAITIVILMLPPVKSAMAQLKKMALE